MKKKKKLLKGILSFFAVIVIIIGAFGIYCANYYHASDDAKNTVNDSSLTVTITNHDKYISFSPLINLTSSGVIFYPGGKVEVEAYAPLCLELAKTGIYVALVKMPLNLAMFGINRAGNVINDNPDIKNFYLAGHSLGGAMGAGYVNKHQESFKGIILLASYTTYDLSSSNLKSLSVYGSNDLVMNKDNYNKYKTNLPSSNYEAIIEGGCHSYFGDYGNQKGDGEPSITRSEQISQTVLYSALFITTGSIIS